MKVWVVYGDWGLGGVTLEGVYTDEAVSVKVLAALRNARNLGTAPHGGWNAEEIEADTMPVFNAQSRAYADAFDESMRKLGGC